MEAPERATVGLYRFGGDRISCGSPAWGTLCCMLTALLFSPIFVLCACEGERKRPRFPDPGESTSVTDSMPDKMPVARAKGTAISSVAC